MKKTYCQQLKSLLCFLFLFPVLLLAQGPLVVDAGTDTNFCGSMEIANSYAPFHIDASVSGGTEPYTYEWTLEPVFYDGQDRDASYFLDSIDVLNPLVKTEPAPNTKILEFVLTVTDSSGAVAMDTVRISASEFSYILGEAYHQIDQGDTVCLYGPNFFGGVPPKHFAWTPNARISDPHSERPCVWPYENTDYDVVMTDAAGCVEYDHTGHNQVNVYPLGIEGQKALADIPFHIRDNRLFLKESHGGNLNIELYNPAGQHLHTSNKHSIDLNGYPAGMYIVRIREKGLVNSYRFFVSH